MRVMSTPAVLAAAEEVLRRIIDTLFEPAVAVTNTQVRELFETGKGDFLRNFSESCRGEFEALRAQQF